jgi:GDP-D-mannose dehydratase
LTTYKALITGISGFVGPYLARRLIELGHQVYGIIPRRADGHQPARLKEMGIISEVQLYSGDITDLTTVLSTIQQIQPDWIFHLAAQSYIPESFRNPLGTFRVNCLGTQNLLEAVRLRDFKSKLIFAGSSEEYGLQFKDSEHFEQMRQKYGVVEPVPKAFPELPVDEEGPLRPMSPYATSKVFGDFAFRNYHNSFGLNTVVSRAFNHEGAGRGPNFVTSAIVRQLVAIHQKQEGSIRIGDVQTFRDWSHVEDIVDGYLLIADKSTSGSVFVLGSMRTNSVLSYILHTISALGYNVTEIQSIKGEKRVRDPLGDSDITIKDLTFKSTVIDEIMLSNNLSFGLPDEGIVVITENKNFVIKFDPLKFRPSEVPILLSDTRKIKNLGFRVKKSLLDIINDQINYYLDPLHGDHAMWD